MNNNELIVSSDNPFLGQIESFLKKTKTARRTQTMSNNIAVREKITFTYEREYIPLPFAKMYQNKTLLEDLTPDACKILIYIALNLEYNGDKIRIGYQDVGIDRRRVARGIVELLLKGVIAREKREWYWVNITLLIVGKIADLPDKTDNNAESSKQ